MSVQFSRQGMAAVPLAAPLPKSSFVRRVLTARDDPAKARILAWLLDTDDARLLGFGLTPEDIALLRSSSGRCWRHLHELRCVGPQIKPSTRPNMQEKSERQS